MSAPANTQPSKGMMMIAAFRAERLKQRSLLREGLHRSHVAPRMARPGGADASEAVEDAVVDAPLPASTAAGVPKPSDQLSIFADLARIVSAEQQNGVAGIDNADPAEVAVQPKVAAVSEAEIPAMDRAAPAEIADATCGADMNQADEAASLALRHVSADADRSDPAFAPQSATPETAAAPQPAYDLSLAEIGFGPGMLIRLSQIGMHTTGDLAQADAVALREALGDISRLVDVEAWIASAQRSANTTSA